MDDRLSLRLKPPAPAPDLEGPSGRAAATGVREPPKIEMRPTQIELRNQLPNLGPYKMGPSIYYDLQVYPGPLLRVVSGPAMGVELDANA